MIKQSVLALIIALYFCSAAKAGSTQPPPSGAAQINALTQYSAPTDGVTDAAPAFVRAIAGAQLLGRRDVFVPSGTYCFASYVDVPSDFTIWAAPGSATLKPCTGDTSSPLLFRAHGVSNLRFVGVTLDGNMLGVQNAYSLVLANSNGSTAADRIVCDQCILTNNRGSFFNFAGATNSGIQRSRILNAGSYYQQAAANPVLHASAAVAAGTSPAVIPITETLGTGFDTAAEVVDLTTPTAVVVGSIVSAIDLVHNTITVNAAPGAGGIQSGDAIAIFEHGSTMVQYGGQFAHDFFVDNEVLNSVGDIEAHQGTDFRCTGNVFHGNAAANGGWTSAWTGNGISSCYVYGTAGLTPFDGVDGVTITNNDIDNISGNCFDENIVRHAAIFNNRIAYCGHAGISVTGDSYTGVGLLDVVVSGNLIRDVSVDAVYLSPTLTAPLSAGATMLSLSSCTGINQGDYAILAGHIQQQTKVTTVPGTGPCTLSLSTVAYGATLASGTVVNFSHTNPALGLIVGGVTLGVSSGTGYAANVTIDNNICNDDQSSQTTWYCLQIQPTLTLTNVKITPNNQWLAGIKAIVTPATFLPNAYTASTPVALAGPLADQGCVTVASGSASAMAAGQSCVVINEGAATSAMVVTLPSAAVEGQLVSVEAQKFPIAGLTVSGYSVAYVVGSGKAAGNTVIPLVSTAAMTDLSIGMGVTSTGGVIPAGTTITAFDAVAKTVTFSAAITGSLTTSNTLTFTQAISGAPTSLNADATVEMRYRVARGWEPKSYTLGTIGMPSFVTTTYAAGTLASGATDFRFTATQAPGVAGFQAAWSAAQGRAPVCSVTPTAGGSLPSIVVTASGITVTNPSGVTGATDAVQCSP